VTWAFMVATVTGLLLGLLFRTPALIASSILGGLLIVFAGLIDGRPALAIGFATGALLCAHQGGYVAGLLFQHLWSRHRQQSGKS
jgi:hypothetical protein